MTDFAARAVALDDADPLAHCRDLFVPSPDVVAYLDGNSLGRPLRVTSGRVTSFIENGWGGRLIRGWDDASDPDSADPDIAGPAAVGDWLTLGERIGDDLGRIALGAAPGQATIGDSTSVLLYKLVRAALDLRPDRHEIVVARDDFPTDRFVVEGIAAERGVTLRWAAGADEAAHALSDRTALVLLSHVAYRSGALADAAATTAGAHAAGALAIWDLCHSVGVVPIALDAWGVDLAVGCTYKYLNGGPGSPAFAYVAERHQGAFGQPIQGWLGSAAPFAMGQGYRPADGIRRVLSGTPPVIASLALRDTLALLDEVGTDAVRAKSEALTAFAVELVDALLPEAGLATPRDPARRGSHLTIDHPAFPELVPRLWERGVIPDFRTPTGIRLGLSPLSTSFAELELGVRAIREELHASAV
ncbi:aminotransferase class V-fold PLP-dependent enzyme [Galbitalea sp. SE-J8]|uniref:kynureninase n=1 Tax=Galbitalea sp. SE-J8 TaxID=3054952 RepID=UPI00259C71BB|nr:aminotransferase class V-fold PLP-dependent enzyme [Galbitalea sp. SE-J8]MDM4763971.1 aminotransferase class V-fold PLP-dependent enzyme [Galbitalea sp. SE-J8]